MPVTSAQRFTAQSRCPICNGHPKLPQGKGVRCPGFFHEDPRYVTCTREEFAGALSIDSNTTPEGFVHYLVGNCNCGVSHDQSPPTPRPSTNNVKNKAPTHTTAEYDYRDADGKLIYQVVRVEPVTPTTPPTKDFYQRHPCPDKDDDWTWGLGGNADKCSCPKIDRLLYRLPELLVADPNATVFLVEGEKDTNRLWDSGLVATCNSGGAKKWEPRYDQWLHGRNGVVLPDNDQDGHDHGQQVAQALYGKVLSLRVLDLPYLPDKGDVSNWLDQGNTVDELVRIAGLAKEWAPEGPAIEPKGMQFLTAAEVAAIAPQEIDWLCRPWIAKGSLTEVDGKIKAAGKTTYLMAMCRKILDGHKFLGEPTSKSEVVYLTEQPMTSLREALRRADLLERQDFHLLLYQDTIGTPWPEVVTFAINKCLEVSAKLLVIDTLPQFASIRGESENSSGAALEALEPVQIAARAGIGVVVSRHDRKAGGDVGDSGRGSSAWGGVSDVIITFRRGDGNTRPTIRHLHSLSRFSETPDRLVIDLLENGEYVSLGEETKVAEQESAKKLWAAMPTNEGDALDRKDLITMADCGNTYGKKIIKAWIDAGHLGKVGKGVTNDRERFWKLNVSRSEPPVVVTNQVDETKGTSTDESSETSKSRSVAYKDEVVTNQVDGAGTTASNNPDGAAPEPLDVNPKSRSVTTPTPISDQPSQDAVEV